MTPVLSTEDAHNMAFKPNYNQQRAESDIYRFWEKELRPQGFRIVAQVLEFPKGKPGDVGLSVVWSE